jgi:hypothetical protein
MTPGTVYRQFACGCLTTENPSIVFIKINGKGKKLTICPHCQKHTALYVRHIRECADCGHIDTSHRMLAGKYCRKCSIHHRAEKRAAKENPGHPVYYQAGSRIKKPAKLVTEPMCRHRIICLPMGLNDLLHCGGCQKFEREDLELIYDRRDHDPFEMALGEAV